jgi:hypothetical protein
MPHWLGRAGVPLFVSHRRLMRRHRLPRAIAPWALDSGAFSEILLHGRFTTTPAAYVAAVRRYQSRIGWMQWAAQQDHMTESWILERSTIAKTVTEAQRWTTTNLLELRTLDAELPIIPVIQGQTLDDYLRHIDAFAQAGIDLHAESLVGLGSVCRRQATGEIAELIGALTATGLRLHGFGIKTSGLDTYGWCLASADSMSWSYRGRRIRPCPHHGNVSCANCLDHALAWRERVMAATQMRRAVQLALL